MESLTWQSLPPWLQFPVLAGYLSLVEASELWGLWLKTPDGESLPLPPNLYRAARVLYLLENSPPTASVH